MGSSVLSPPTRALPCHVPSHRWTLPAVMSPADSAAAAPGRLDIHSSAEFEVVQTIRERACCPVHQPAEGRGSGDGEDAVCPGQMTVHSMWGQCDSGPQAAVPAGPGKGREQGVPQGAGLCHPQVQPGPLWPLFPNIMISSGSLLLRLRDRSLREVQRLAPKDPDLPLQDMFNNLT